MEQEEKKELKKNKSVICLVAILIVLLLIVIGALIIMQFGDDGDSPNSKPSIEFVDKNDITTSYGITKSSIVITIQANTNIESLSADIDILDINGNVIDSKTVKYSKMQSGSKYEVTFYLSEDKLEQAYRYNVHDIDGILES